MTLERNMISMNILFNYFIATALAQHNPNFLPNRTSIVSLFQWPFVDIAIECEQYLGPMGFGGVEVSPVTENQIIPGRPIYEIFQPVSYKIENRLGNESQLIEMIARCNQVGVRVYVDVVLNHMAREMNASAGMIGTAGSVAYRRTFPGVPYFAKEFHRPCGILHYYDAHVVRNCDLYGLPDLDQSNESVRCKLVTFMNRLISMGVAGFRIGSAKYMWPNDLKIIYRSVDNVSVAHGFTEGQRPFFYQEVLDIGEEPISKTEYNFLGAVTEFMFAIMITKLFSGDMKLQPIRLWGPAMGLLDSEDAFVFVDSHDLQRQNYLEGTDFLSFKKPKQYAMATMFMLAFSYGTVNIRSSFEFDTIEQGPPADSDDRIRSPHGNGSNCADGWVCEHRWHEVKNMLEFRRVVGNATSTRWQQFSVHQAAFCRGTMGLVVVNVGVRDLDESVWACVPPGNYCDIVTGWDERGNCLNVISVNGDNRAHVQIPVAGEHGMIVIHVESRLD